MERGDKCDFETSRAESSFETSKAERDSTSLNWPSEIFCNFVELDLPHDFVAINSCQINSQRVLPQPVIKLSVLLLRRRPPLYGFNLSVPPKRHFDLKASETRRKRPGSENSGHSEHVSRPPPEM